MKVEPESEYKGGKLGGERDVGAGSGSCSSSNEMEEEDSSESALQLLLDFPTNNDMSFLSQPDFYGNFF